MCSLSYLDYKKLGMQSYDMQETRYLNEIDLFKDAVMNFVMFVDRIGGLELVAIDLPNNYFNLKI